MWVFGLQFNVLFAFEQRPLTHATVEVPRDFSEGDCSLEGALYITQIGPSKGK